MDKIKMILLLLAIIFVSLGVLATIGLIYSALQYLLLFGVLCLAGVIGVRLLLKKDSREFEPPDSPRELKDIDRTLEKYKRQLK